MSNHQHLPQVCFFSVEHHGSWQAYTLKPKPYLDPKEPTFLRTYHKEIIIIRSPKKR